MLGEKQVVGVGPIDPADLVDVAKTFGDQERRLGTGSLEQRVDDNGRAVQEQVALGQVNPGAIEGVLDALVQMPVGRQGLAKGDLAPGLVKAGHVGEGAANIDGDAQAWWV